MIITRKVQIYNIINSLTLLLLSNTILAMFISYDPFSSHLNSTGFTEISSLYYYKNTLVNWLFENFGGSIYILPIMLLFWSYRLFFHQVNRLLLLRLYILALVIPFSSVILNISHTWQPSVMGYYLTNVFYFFSDYSLLFVTIALVLLFFVSGISVRNLITAFKIFIWLFSMGIEHISRLITTAKKKLFQYWKTQSSSRKPQIRETNKLASAFASLNKSMWNNNLSSNYSSPNVPSPPGEFSLQPVSPPIREQTSYEPYISNPGYIDTPPSHPTVEEPPLSNNMTSISFNHIDKLSYNIPTTLLDAKEERNTITTQEIKELAIKLERVISEFGIEGKIVNIQTGPVVTLFEITIPPGVKTSKLLTLETDIALRMKAYSARIAVVPGKDVLGIEIPNHKRKTVYLRKLLEHKAFIKSEANLPLILGLDISGKPVVADLANMPHLLVAGTTGSGKSVAVNAMILSLLYRYHPDYCKMIMIDPKMLELSIYHDIPHLLTPVVTDSKKAIYALKWAVKQMEHRYTLMSYLGVRNINGYNQKIKDVTTVDVIKNTILQKDGFEIEFEFMPYIIIIIDEMADLMLVAGKEIESAVQRLAQMARAAGIHLIMATQRPSVDVITGTIKANFPSRISFQVSSRIDSNTILGDKGAEQLLGKGDMLYMMGVGRLLRVHGPFVSDKEVEKVVSVLKSFGTPEYINEVTTENTTDNFSHEHELDELYNEVLQLIQTEQKVSTSYIQRRFQIGYNRAARIVEALEENGVISKASPTGKREILIK